MFSPSVVVLVFRVCFWSRCFRCCRTMFWLMKTLLVCDITFICTASIHNGEGDGTPLQHSCLENPMDGGAWWAAVHGVAQSRTRLSDFTFTHWRRKWQPTAVFLPGESQGWQNQVGCRLWGRTESDTTEVT